MKRLAMRPCLAAFFAALVVPLIGAASNPALLNAPSVVVYPFLASQGIDPEAGSGVSVVIATQISQMGGVNVKPAPPGTQQKDYQLTAQKLGVDYYISGFVTPLGDQVSLVEQLVSTRSGSIIWSDTSQLAVYGDAKGPGTRLHDAIEQYASRAFSTLSDQNVSTGSGQQPRGSNEANVQIAGPHRSSGGSGDTGNSNSGNTVAAASLPATPAAPSRTAAILTFDGNADPTVKDYVPGYIVQSSRKYGFDASRAPISSKDLANLGQLVCAQTGAAMLVGGTVDVSQTDPESGIWFDARIVLTSYDCSNLNAKPHQVSAQAESGTTQTAIDIAVDHALKSVLSH